MSQSLFCLKHRTVPVLLFFLFLMGCSRQTEPLVQQTRGKTMGTLYSVKVIASSPDEAGPALAGVQAQLDTVDHLMSNWVADSDTSRFNGYREATLIPVSKHTLTVVANALMVAEKTDGALDPTLSPLIEQWGFGAKGRQPNIPSEEAIQAARARTGYQHVIIEGDRLGKAIPELTLNLGANAKGYGVDVVVAWLLEQGLDQFMVEVGGEVRVVSPQSRKEPWRIGIRHPNSPADGQMIKVAHLRNEALATSGDYFNFFEHEGIRYCHILDPKTGWPVPAKVASVSVIAPDCMTADALATGLMVLGPEKALAIVESMPGIECLIFTRNDDDHLTEHHSSGMAAFLVDPE